MNVQFSVTVSTQIWRHSEKHENDAHLKPFFGQVMRPSVRCVPKRVLMLLFVRKQHNSFMILQKLALQNFRILRFSALMTLIIFSGTLFAYDINISNRGFNRIQCYIFVRWAEAKYHLVKIRSLWSSLSPFVEFKTPQDILCTYLRSSTSTETTIYVKSTKHIL